MEMKTVGWDFIRIIWTLILRERSRSFCDDTVPTSDPVKTLFSHLLFVNMAILIILCTVRLQAYVYSVCHGSTICARTTTSTMFHWVKGRKSGRFRPIFFEDSTGPTALLLFSAVIPRRKKRKERSFGFISSYKTFLGRCRRPMA